METYPKEYFYKKIVVAKLYMDKHFVESITIQNIANEARFSKFDFIRQFRKTYGLTPYNYLKRVRLKKASELLRHSDLSVKDICFSIGYDSISSFYGLFKNEFGSPPKEYQKECLEKANSIKNKPLNYVPNCFAENLGWKKSNFEEVK